MLKRVAGSNAAQVAVLRLAGMAAVLALQVLLARLLGLDQYGIFTLASAWLILLSVPARGAFDLASVRFLASYRGSGQWSEFHGFRRFARQATLALSLTISGIAALIVLLLGTRIDGQTALAMLIVCLALPVLTRMQLQAAELRAVHRPVQASFPETLLKPVATALLAAAVWLATPQLITGPSAVAVSAVAIVCCLAVAWRWNAAAMRQIAEPAVPSMHRREWLRVALPLTLMSGATVLDSRADVIMIGALLTSADVGVYSVSARLCSLLGMGQLVVNFVVAPKISEAYGRGDQARITALAQKAAIAIFAPIVPLVLLFVLAGDFFLSLFGPEFMAGDRTLRILVASQVVHALTGSAGYLLTMTAHQNTAFRILLTTAIVNIVANAILIPQVGIEGAAVATLASSVVRNIWLYRVAKHRLGIDPSILSLLRRRRGPGR